MFLLATAQTQNSSHHHRKRSHRQAFLHHQENSTTSITDHDGIAETKKSHDARQPLDESELDDIAGQICRHWKQVGRKLNIPQLCLEQLDLSVSTTEQEKAFQMLMEWRERSPEYFTRGRLYFVLKQCDLRHTANRVLTLHGDH